MKKLIHISCIISYIITVKTCKLIRQDQFYTFEIENFKNIDYRA